MATLRTRLALAAGLTLLSLAPSLGRAETLVIPYANPNPLSQLAPPGLIMTGPLVGNVSAISISARPFWFRQVTKS
jgi:hypothetical protein